MCLRPAALLRQAIALQGNVPLYHYNLGVVLMRQGEHAGAVAAYETLLQLDPSFTEAYHNLVVRQEQGQFEAAAVAYQAVLRLQPNHVAAYNNLGTVLKAQGDLDAARVAYTTALRLRPDFAEAHNNIGLLWQEQHNLRAARAAYETALRLKPHYTEAYHNLGAVFQVVGRPRRRGSGLRDHPASRPPLCQGALESGTRVAGPRVISPRVGQRTNGVCRRFRIRRAFRSPVGMAPRSTGGASWCGPSRA